ncbi:SOS response-associated peptidase [Bacillus alveayuensis]|jgi:putative SOS response-associated peptidase YedK|uniref:SOS response-associated peptidase n=1 Tax=Aeribacillus alveayuensis TaxID=279215 RepID=UPI0005CCFBB3|nr:SOS response-associated peptidase [Bacillus alveayuensis]
MCGRFTLSADEQKILTRFQTVKTSEIAYKQRYNIAPSQNVLAIVNDGQTNRLSQFRWGFIPYWAKDMKIGHKMINARAETLAEKPAFKHAFRKQRCIIPADGFYEWKKTANGKQPMRIKLKSNEVFGFAGLWSRWKAPDGQIVHSCTIITTEPNELMQDIHNRMPVILRKEDEKVWLDQSIEDTYLLQDLLKPYPADKMEAYEVSTLVNSPRNEGPDLIKKYSSTKRSR